MTNEPNAGVFNRGLSRGVSRALAVAAFCACNITSICDAASSLPANAASPGNAGSEVALAQQAIHATGGIEFVWNFSCGGGDCLIGKFIGGDYWIAPKTDGEQIILHSALPAGERYGLTLNPVEKDKQGVLSCQGFTYKSQLNLMMALPVQLHTGSSLVKALPRTADCRAKSARDCCIERYDVLTVLQQAPKDGGASTFRPGFAGNDKRLFALEDFDFDRIPADRRVPIQSRTEYLAAHYRWHAPYVDHFMGTVGDRGRAFAPHGAISDYGAEQASVYLNDLLGVMAPAPLADRMPAITGLLQRGIDLYTSWQAGITWPSGAGQQMGRKPPIAFFAALVKDDGIRRNVMAMSARGNDTQEDGQIRIVPKKMGGGGIAIWGDVHGPCEERTYWANLFGAGAYAASPKSYNAKADNVKTCGDPYGWIDGPAGVPGTAYMSCCSTGGFIAYSIAQNLMPELCRVSNDRELNAYVKRILVDGIHTQPDRCAPPDPRESPECQPYKNGLSCLYYRKTWGPDPKHPGQCIPNGTNGTYQVGRFPNLHGKPLTPIYNEPKSSKIIRRDYPQNLFDNCSSS